MLKSTEIVIEQLIIGLLSIVIVNLFVWGVPLPQLNSGGNVYQSFFFGVLLVIAAYAAGIVVDRWSDTILEQLEKRVRLREYLKCITYKKFSSNSYSLPNEASLRLEIKKEDGGLADYHDYLRRRMRITRGITCLLPALFLALVFFDHQCNRQELVRWAFGGGAFCFYALVLVFSIILPKKCQVPNTHPTDKLRSKLLKFGWNGLSSSGQNSRDKNVSIQFRLRDLFHPIDPAILGLIIFVLVGWRC
jgi:hypothetical protein